MSQVKDISVKDGWSILQNDRSALLVDVRTFAEWHYVGLPLLFENQLKTIEWLTLPDMAINTNFKHDIMAISENKTIALLFICRSGFRSKEAAEFANQLGYKNCYNLLEGFEGKLNNDGHRGKLTGWKACNLPWKQH